MMILVVAHTQPMDDSSQARKMIDCKIISQQQINHRKKEQDDEKQQQEEGQQLQRRRRQRPVRHRRHRWPYHLPYLSSFWRHFERRLLSNCLYVLLTCYMRLWIGWAILSSLSSFPSSSSSLPISLSPLTAPTIFSCHGFQYDRYIQRKPFHHQQRTRQYRLLQQQKSVDGDRAVLLDHRSVAVFSLLESRRRTKQKHQQIFSIRVLERNPSFLQLEPRDKAFARLLLSTVERREGQIDKVLSSFMTRSGGTEKQQQQQQTKKMGTSSANDPTDSNSGSNDRRSGSRSGSRGRRQRPVDQLCDAALKVGAAQLLFLDVPKYAAIQETVQVLRNHPTIHVPAPQIKFVNAILRSVDREGSQRLIETTSVLDNVDPWLCDQWIKSYGRDGTESIVAEAMSQSPIFISINQYPNASCTERQIKLRRMHQAFSPTSTAAASAASVPAVPAADNTAVDESNANEQGSSVLLPHGSICVNTDKIGSVVSKWPYYDEGEWWVQDAAAAVPAIALETALTKREINRKKLGSSDEEGPLDLSSSHDQNLLHNLNVVDLCSAPGGKTAQLCSMGFGTVTAIEISTKRSRVLEQNLNRLGMLQAKNQIHDEVGTRGSDLVSHSSSCQIVIQDGSVWTPETMHVDGILVDAPCSASGVGSRQPDVLRKSFKDILPDLLQTQRELAAHAVDNILQPDGVVVYATCSLLKQEGEDQARWLLERCKNDETASNLEPIPFEVGEIAGFDEFIDSNGWLRILPGRLQGPLAHIDGFFVARMKKIK